MSEYQGGFQLRSYARWLPAFFSTEKQKEEGFFFVWILIEKYSQKLSEELSHVNFPQSQDFWLRTN